MRIIRKSGEENKKKRENTDNETLSEARVVRSPLCTQKLGLSSSSSFALYFFFFRRDDDALREISRSIFSFFLIKD